MSLNFKQLYHDCWSSFNGGPIREVLAERETSRRKRSAFLGQIAYHADGLMRCDGDNLPNGRATAADGIAGRFRKHGIINPVGSL